MVKFCSSKTPVDECPCSDYYAIVDMAVYTLSQNTWMRLIQIMSCDVC